MSTDFETLRKLAETVVNGSAMSSEEFDLREACTPATILALVRIAEAADLAMQYRDGRRAWPDNHAMGRQFDAITELIAAAPELLALLRDLKDAMPLPSGEDVKGWEEREELRDRIRAAIAKATGA